MRKVNLGRLTSCQLRPCLKCGEKKTVKKITLWKEKKDFFYVEKSRSFCAKSQRTETEKCWAGLHTPSRALHSLLVPQASGSGDKTRERGERRRGDGSRVKERRGEGKVGRGEWRKGQEIRGRWRSRKGGRGRGAFKSKDKIHPETHFFLRERKLKSGNVLLFHKFFLVQ